MHYLRIALATFGFVSVFLAPTWVPLSCIVLLSLRFRAWEGIVLGALIDLLWLPTGDMFMHFPFYTAASIIIVWGLEPLRLELLR